MELAKNQNMEVGTVTNTNFSASDIQIPRLLICQPGSPAVVDGDAKFGEYRSNLDMSLLGSDKKPLEFIPISLYKVWHIKEGSDLKDVVKVTPQNENT